MEPDLWKTLLPVSEERLGEREYSGVEPLERLSYNSFFAFTSEEEEVVVVVESLVTLLVEG